MSMSLGRESPKTPSYHALMIQASASESARKSIPLNIYKLRKFSFDALSLSRHITRRARAGGSYSCAQWSRRPSCSVQRGAASLSLAVLESERRKGEVATDSVAEWIGTCEKTAEVSRCYEGTTQQRLGVDKRLAANSLQYHQESGRECRRGNGRVKRRRY